MFITQTKQEIIDLISNYYPEVSANTFAQYNFVDNFNTIPKSSKIITGNNPGMLLRYYHKRILVVSARGLTDIARHTNSKFSLKCYQSWLDEILTEKLPIGYSILDMFFWEHRAGRWTGQSISVTDLFGDF